MRLGLKSLSWEQIQWNQWNCSHVKGFERGLGLLLVFSCLKVRRLLYVPENSDDNTDQEGKDSVIFVKLRILLAISTTAICFEDVNSPYFFFFWKPIDNFFFPSQLFLFKTGRRPRILKLKVLEKVSERQCGGNLSCTLLLTCSKLMLFIVHILRGC